MTADSPEPAHRAAAARFWQWWASACSRIEDACAAGSLTELADEVTAQVHALDPALQWEVGADDLAVHAFCVSGAGDPTLRALAQRVIAVGPGDDATWAFHPVRLPRPGAIDQQLKYAGEDLSLAEMRFSIQIDDEREVLDLMVFHPGFEVLDERARLTVAFLVIDGILGEDGVERWIGTVEVAAEPLADGLPAQALAEAADGLADRQAEPTWCLMSGTDGDGRSVFILARRPLKRVEAPTFDLHAAVMMIGYETNDSGLPTTEALEQLTSLEDGLAAALDGDGLVAAHVTVAGRRTTHIYCDQFGPSPGLISAWSSTLVDDRIDAVVAFDLDPGWEAVKSFR